MTNSLFETLAVRYIPDLINDFDLTDFQAAGIVGNGGEESGGFTKVQEINPLGGGAGGLGHFQWTGRSSTNNRRLLFEQWLARPANVAKGYAPDVYEANYSFLFRELTGTESASLAALKRTSTLEEATEVFMDLFERPGVEHLDVRIDYARRALSAYRNSGINPATYKAPAHAPGTTEILPPVGQIDLQALAPLVNAFLPLLLQALVARQPGAPGAAPVQGIDLAAVLGQLLGGCAPAAALPAPPPPPPPPAAAAPVPKTALGVGLAGLFGSLAAMATGHLGTPLGMGEAPTVAGNLVPLAFTAIAALGPTGFFGPFGTIVGQLAGMLTPAAKP